MIAALLAVQLLFAGTFSHGLFGALDRLSERSLARAIGEHLIHVEINSDEKGDEDDADEKDDADEAQPALPPGAPRPSAALPPQPPPPPGSSARPDEAPFTEHAQHVPAVEVLHRVAKTAGWSLTLIGIDRETIDVDQEKAAPRDALRAVLRSAGAMGVLKGDKLVVIPVGSGPEAGLLIEKSDSRQRHLQKGSAARGRGSSGGDLVKVFQGNLVVPAGTVLSGDAVAVGGSVEVEAGAVVQGSTAAVGGSVVVQPGGVVVGDSVTLLGTTELKRGAQVLGEQVQIGLGPVFKHKAHATSGSGLSRLGPLGLFPTLALFALVYLLGLFALRGYPERVRALGRTVVQHPLRSFFVGFLCFLLVWPALLLLLISVVGIPLVPLLPLSVFVAVALGLSGLSLRIGERLPAGEGQGFVPPAALGMGLLALLLASLVPFLGTPLLLLVSLVSLGAAVSSRVGKQLPPG